MVLGDTTILASRASYVDFSLPYAESGLVHVVKNKKAFDMWIFTKPLRWDLWLAIILSCIAMGLVIWILERGIINPAPVERPATLYLVPIEVLAFRERNTISNKWSFCMLMFWSFMAFILLQSFTANLSAILTINQLIEVSDQDCYIGYQGASFVKRFLVDELKYNETKLRKYSSPEEFDWAMQQGSKNGGVDIIIDEVPYVKFLNNRYDPRYKVHGKTYRIEGLGFAFPVGSPLAPYFSRAILNVTQGPEMMSIEQKNFGPGYSSQDPLFSALSKGTSGLSFYHFAGLFIVVAALIGAAVIWSERAIILSVMGYVKRRLLHTVAS